MYWIVISTIFLYTIFLYKKHAEYLLLFLVDMVFFLLRATAFDFCKVKRGKDGGTLRTMSGEKLLKTLPVLQAQVLKFAAGKREFFEGETFETPVKEIWLKAFYPKVDALLEFDCSAQDLNNGVINCSFMLLFRDLIRSGLHVLSFENIPVPPQVVCLLQ